MSVPVVAAANFHAYRFLLACYRFDGWINLLVIKTDVTYTVTHQTTQILPPAGPPGRQNALDESHKKPSGGAERAESTMACRPWARTKVLPCGVSGATASLGRESQPA